MDKYIVTEKRIIDGKKRNIYKKEKSKTLYIRHKNEFIKLKEYYHKKKGGNPYKILWKEYSDFMEHNLLPLIKYIKIKKIENPQEYVSNYIDKNYSILKEDRDNRIARKLHVKILISSLLYIYSNYNINDIEYRINISILSDILMTLEEESITGIYEYSNNSKMPYHLNNDLYFKIIITILKKFKGRYNIDISDYFKKNYKIRLDYLKDNDTIISNTSIVGLIRKLKDNFIQNKFKNLRTVSKVIGLKSKKSMYNPY